MKNKLMFMGTPDFAVYALDALWKAFQDRFEFAVVTMPDKPVGRHWKLCPPPVKPFALAHGIP
ncbi:MAG TPA: methionyl-tRNA formyltransferase, partial [Clostridiales bacterium]|nr:methionyl-tRNA formyltransferase [Clostridiales bacterium]